MKIFLVQPRSQDANTPAPKRLIKAERRAQVESFLIGEQLIEVATQDECVTLGAAGVRVEDADTK